MGKLLLPQFPWYKERHFSLLTTHSNEMWIVEKIIALYIALSSALSRRRPTVDIAPELPTVSAKVPQAVVIIHLPSPIEDRSPEIRTTEERRYWMYEQHFKPFRGRTERYVTGEWNDFCEIRNDIKYSEWKKETQPNDSTLTTWMPHCYHNLSFHKRIETLTPFTLLIKPLMKTFLPNGGPYANKLKKLNSKNCSPLMCQFDSPNSEVKRITN